MSSDEEDVVGSEGSTTADRSGEPAASEEPPDVVAPVDSAAVSHTLSTTGLVAYTIMGNRQVSVHWPKPWQLRIGTTVVGYFDSIDDAAIRIIEHQESPEGET